MIQVFRVQDLVLKKDIMKEDNVVQYKNLTFSSRRVTYTLTSRQGVPYFRKWRRRLL